MKPLVVATLVLLMSGPSAAECIPPLGADELMLSVVKQEDESGRGNSLEIFANGRVRVVFDCHARETWLDSWAVEQIPRSLHPVFHERTDPIPEEDSRRDYEVLLNCFDVETNLSWQRSFQQRELSKPAWAETSRIRDWAIGQAALPVWVSGPWPPRVCRPEVRRDWQLGVEEAPWCDMSMSLSPPGQDKEEFREWLRERLRNLPRGLQEPGETSEERSPERTYSSVSLEPEPDTSSSDPPSPRR